MSKKEGEAREKAIKMMKAMGAKEIRPGTAPTLTVDLKRGVISGNKVIRLVRD